MEALGNVIATHVVEKRNFKAPSKKQSLYILFSISLTGAHYLHHTPVIPDQLRDPDTTYTKHGLPMDTGYVKKTDTSQSLFHRHVPTLQ